MPDHVESMINIVPRCLAFQRPTCIFLRAKLSKRNVDLRFLDDSAKPEKMGGDKLKQPVKVKAGIDAETAKKIQGLLKQSKLKVQASIQGDTVRVTGGKRDDLQTAMALIRKDVALPLGFNNFRD